MTKAGRSPLKPTMTLQEVAETLTRRFMETGGDVSLGQFEIGLFADNKDTGERAVYVVRFACQVEKNPDPSTLLPGSGGMRMQ